MILKNLLLVSALVCAVTHVAAEDVLVLTPFNVENVSSSLENLEVGPAVDAPKPTPSDGPVIQLALLLDTSNSMDGLIDQARSRLWRIVNEMGEARVEGQIPQLQVALYQYGNSGLPRDDDYVQLRAPFTTDLDVISEQLFSLSTNGGQEYCGAVMREVLTELAWLDGGRGKTLRVVVIAGNEPFNQGTEPYQEWTSAAQKQGVIVNTIFCGNEDEGRRTLWADGATSGGGHYAAIDQNRKGIEIPTPFDDVLRDLNDALNGTYLGYGKAGKAGLHRQLTQDVSNSTLSFDAFASRVATKGTSNYATSNWDLVEANDSGDVALEELEEEELPEELQGLEKEEIETELSELAAERKQIQAEILKAHAARENFLADAPREAERSGGKDLDDALITALRAQAKQAGFDSLKDKGGRFTSDREAGGAYASSLAHR